MREVGRSASAELLECEPGGDGNGRRDDVRHQEECGEGQGHRCNHERGGLGPAALCRENRPECRCDEEVGILHRRRPEHDALKLQLLEIQVPERRRDGRRGLGDRAARLLQAMGQRESEVARCPEGNAQLGDGTREDGDDHC